MAPSPLKSTLLTLTIFIPQISSFNTDVHMQIAHAALELVSNDTRSVLPAILKRGTLSQSSSSSPSTLGKPTAPEAHYFKSVAISAAWPDYFANVPEGLFSKPWHFIDTEDNPPTSCALHFQHDCSNQGCVVSALANQAVILRACVRDELLRKDSRRNVQVEYNATTCVRALMWTLHFNGDINQPLHASGKWYGGNLAMVKFGGLMQRLHAVWDGSILYSLIAYEKDDSEPPTKPAPFNPVPLANDTIHPHFVSLLHRIKTHPDSFLSLPSTWTACTDPSSKETALKCATRWAGESNAISCDAVWGRLKWVAKGSVAEIPNELQVTSKLNPADLNTDLNIESTVAESDAEPALVMQNQIFYQDQHHEQHEQMHTSHSQHQHLMSPTDDVCSLTGDMAADFASIANSELIPDPNYDLLYDGVPSYAEQAWSVIDTQLGKSVMRLSTWLDTIVGLAKMDADELY